MEQVVPIVGHITYGITPDARIFCLRTGRELVPFAGADKYKRVYLTGRDGTSAYSLSRLMGTTYIPNPLNKPEIDHIDRDRSNNRVENLRWADDYDQSENKVGWGKYKKHISMENYGSYCCWNIQIRNRKCKFKRRLDCRTHTYEEAIELRNATLLEHDLPIID
jgi:hypothetical protein